MNLLMMKTVRQLCLILSFCVFAKAFPADVSGTSDTKIVNAKNDKSSSSTSVADNLPASKTSSVSTTSSLLFKDTKPILTYLLGQPKKQGSVSSPAQLLSPDRYEFFTFDDDGQIVKKLMSVKEIQKIIANNEKGLTTAHETPIEYYQILTVTPDVESIPSVSRINPNEPLFSIHDVIASVQNVLKSEIKNKEAQLKSNETNLVAAASSDHFEILTEKPETPYTLESQKIASTSAQPTTIPKNVTTETAKNATKSSIPTHPMKNVNSSEINDIYATTPLSETTKVRGSLETLRPLPLRANASQNSVTRGKPVSHSSTPQAENETQSQEKTSTSQATEAAPTTKSSTDANTMPPLLLSDAHPGIISNESFLDMKPIRVEQFWMFDDSPSAAALTDSSKAPAENVVKSDSTDENPPIREESFRESSTTSILLESSTFVEQSPFTPELANSVSSVLWQIASENAMFDNASTAGGVAESTAATTVKEETSEKIIQESVSKKDFVQSTISVETTTAGQIQTEGSGQTEKVPEKGVQMLEDILKPQNRPRPFQKISAATTTEKEIPDLAESRIDSLFSTTPTIDDKSIVSTVASEVTTEAEETTFVSKMEESKLDASTGNALSFPSTIEPFGIIVVPEAVTQSPEHLKLNATKVGALNVGANLANKTQKIDGVELIQEANIGQIPRTTEFPGQIVKEIQRKETPEFVPIENATTAEPEKNPTIAPSTYSSSETTASAFNKLESRTETVEGVDENVEELTKAENVDAKKDEKQRKPSTEKVEISFVPMVIKTPLEFKQEEANLKVENQTVADRETTTPPREVVTQIAATEASTQAAPDDVETKELPTETEHKSILPMTSSNNNEKDVSDESPDTDADGEEMGTLKQNFQIKPGFSKPQKLIYKPMKPKPQADTKPTKLQSDAKPHRPVVAKPLAKEPAKGSENKKPYENHLQSSPSVLELEAAPDENLGLEATVANLDGDIKQFSDLCNDLAFSLWTSITHNGLSFVRSVVISPFAVTSLLAMVFLGARGPTSGQMNDVLKLDEMVTFNPHLVFRNVTESLVISRNPEVATAAFVRELYSDKSKGKLLDFYKERVQQFYDGHVEEVNFKTIGDTLRRQTNHLVKRQTWGKITDFLRGSNLMPKPPLAAFSANIFQTDCTKASTKDRDGEMYFVILPASRLRRLVPIPAVVWRSGFLAGYEPQLDATAVSIGQSNSAVSTILVLPGQQGLIAPGDTLARLEHLLLGSSYKKGYWSGLMRSLLPRPGLELQIPRMSHKSVINVTTSLQRMGLKDLFSADKADLTGLNGLANDLHLSDMLQVNLFSTCGEELIGARHHSEIYPATPILRREKSADSVLTDSLDSLFAVSDFEDPAISALPLELRPRQARVPLSKPGARIPEPPRLRFDRPFLYFVRHNPTGLILHMGRFNPRLTP